MKKLLIISACFFGFNVFSQSENCFTITAGDKNYDVYLNQDGSLNELVLLDDSQDLANFKYEVTKSYFDDNGRIIGFELLTYTTKEVERFNARGGLVPAVSSYISTVRDNESCYPIFINYDGEQYVQIKNINVGEERSFFEKLLMLLNESNQYRAFQH